MAFPKTFRAYQYDNFGPIESELKLRTDVQQQTLDAGQVRIKVRSVGLNPFEYFLVEMGSFFFDKTPSAENPFKIGYDASGEVVEIGDDVKNLNVGDEIYTAVPFPFSGTLSEYFVADEKYVAKKPANLSFDEAAAVPAVAITAHTGMFQHAELKKDQTVLILGGSTCVGMMAVQFAHSIGAKVIATTSARNVELVKSLGADQVVDYTKEKWVDVVAPHSVDAFYDCGAEASAWNDGAQLVLKKETGRFITLLPMAKPITESQFGAKLIGEVHTRDHSTEKLNVITEYIESGKLKPVIDTVYPFEKVLDAYAKLKTRHARGKLVIQVNP